MIQGKGAHSLLARSVLVLACVIGLCFLAAFLISSPDLSASHGAFPQLAFQSPVGSPRLALSKTVDNNAPEPEDVITYTLTYSSTNPGSQAFDVRLYDFLPAGVTFLSASPSEAYFEDGVLMFADTSVGPVNETVDVRVQVLGGYEYLYNHGLLAAECVTPTHASLLTTVEQSSSLFSLLRVTKTGPPAVLIGDELAYTLRCENTSGSTVREVKVVDILPTGLSLVDVSQQPDIVTPPLLEWSVGDLEPGEPWMTVIAATAPAHPGVIANAALASGRGAVMTETLFSTHVVTAILHVTKTCSVPLVNQGDRLVYTLTYHHEGDQPVAWAVLTDTFSGIIIEGTEPQPTDITSGRGVWAIDTLNPGESGQIVITATVSGGPGTVLHNIADIVGPANTWPGHAELFTPVALLVYLPLIMRGY